MLFDSHTHFNNEDLTEEERTELFAETEEAVADGRMAGAVDIGFDPDSSELALKHAAEHSWCYAAVGCHPHDAKKMDEVQLERIREMAADDKAVAIGEIGLDFHYDLSDREVQREWFRRQIRLANELRMPISIHSREADQEVMDILKEEGAFSDERKSWFGERPVPEGYDNRDARVLLHCFSGSAELAQQYIKLGATLSIAGPVTYKNNRKTVQVVQETPAEFLLVETDAPYLTPVPMRGQRNKPVYVEHTARRVAAIKGMTLEELAEKTKENAMRFYGID